ncbi:MAG: response regulator transcription factor [Acidobacteria bacterium]|nr:response regulator transcription factor [Acidobacteriota bacterium]MBK8149611.1 response regulator transcription factor [Acidobacteriota bacterium]MBK8809730.1 response regulator transcription factor [Acidobacteriota bacterium]
MNTRLRILIVDDEPQIVRVMRTGLIANGYETRFAENGRAALEVFDVWQPDMIVTDLAMPEMDGLELCRQIRAISEVPIIVLSVKGEERTKIDALDAGADDYVTKPFGINELLARLRAVQRRSRARPNETSNVLNAGDFRIDLDSREVIVSDKAIHLTPKEYDLLVYFVSHPGKVLTQRTLLGAVWGGNFTEQPEYLRVFVGQLRKKIEKDPGEPRYIVTEPWVGYRFNPGSV